MSPYTVNKSSKEQVLMLDHVCSSWAVEVLPDCSKIPAQASGDSLLRQCGTGETGLGWPPLAQQLPTLLQQVMCLCLVSQLWCTASVSHALLCSIVLILGRCLAIKGAGNQYVLCSLFHLFFCFALTETAAAYQCCFHKPQDTSVS